LQWKHHKTCDFPCTNIYSSGDSNIIVELHRTAIKGMQNATFPMPALLKT